MKKESGVFFGFDYLILSFILIVALFFRLYKINTPLADIHSWRQADTAAVARNFVRNGFNLLKPQFDDISISSTGLENPQGLRFVEFPLYNASFALLYRYLPVLPLEVFGRLISVFFSLFIIAILYYFVLKEKNRIAAIVSAGIYAVFPFYVFFSRIVLPETTALALVFLALFFLYLWAEPKTKNLIGFVFYSVSLIFLATAVLVKPTIVFYCLSLVFLFWRKYQVNIIKRLDFYIYFTLASAPFLLWRHYISAFPQGIPPSEWLINYVNTSEGMKNIFFSFSFFRWIFFERINNVIFGGYLTAVFLIGVISRQKKYFLFSLLISALIYLLTFQGGNVQHEYYQTLILPPLAIFVGLGISTMILEGKTFLNPVISIITTIAIIFLSFFFSFYIVRNYYNYPQDLIQMAKIINTLTLSTDKVVTDRTGDTTLLYLADRRGAPAINYNLPDLKKHGYNYFETANKEVIQNAKSSNNFEVVFENSQFALFKL